MSKEFQKWWSSCYTWRGESFQSVADAAFDAGWKAAMEEASKKRGPSPRELNKPVGAGAFHEEQQFCFSKGWKEGVAAFKKMLRSKA